MSEISAVSPFTGQLRTTLLSVQHQLLLCGPLKHFLEIKSTHHVEGVSVAATGSVEV